MPTPAARRPMLRPVPAPVLAAFALAVLAPAAVGDDVTRTDGGRGVRGRVTGASRAAVTVQPVGNDPAEEVPAAVIEDVSFDGEPPALGTVRNRERRGRLADALAGYRDAAEAMRSAGPLAAAEIDFLIARTLGKQALNDPAKRDEATAALNEFLTARPDHYRLDPALRVLAEVQTAAGDLDAAAATLGRLAESPSPAFRTAAAVARGRLALKRDDADAALAAFDGVLQDADGRAAEEAKVGRAAALARLGRHDEALTVLDGVLAAADPGDADLRAAAHLKKGDSLQARGETKPAILEYLRVDVLYPGAAGPHAESLYHLSRLWNAAGFPARAADAAAELRSEYPNSEWAGRLAAG